MQDDGIFSWIKNKVKHQGTSDHKRAKKRGNRLAELKLHDKEDQITKISPKTREGQPYSYRGFYPMKSEKHGVALIINNIEFEKHPLRTGTERDEHNLTETWRFLGYHIVIMRNCTTKDMKRTFDGIDDLLCSAKEVAHDSFICCILSHGEEGQVFGSDSLPLKYTEMQTYLAKSETLRGRPKVFFIQACQGKSKGPLPVVDQNREIASDDDRISEYTDFYLSYASVEGDKCYRDIYIG